MMGQLQCREHDGDDDGHDDEDFNRALIGPWVWFGLDASVVRWRAIGSWTLVLSSRIIDHHRHCLHISHHHRRHYHQQYHHH